MMLLKSGDLLGFSITAGGTTLSALSAKFAGDGPEDPSVEVLRGSPTAKLLWLLTLYNPKPHPAFVTEAGTVAVSWPPNAAATGAIGMKVGDQTITLTGYEKRALVEGMKTQLWRLFS